ncbi:MAG TPA: alpha/beta hydrolase, partial [Steroidobacteraceae bacterium]|nr:alpha/beta hydrolase [Steroidobacteraceae bacterium]
MIYSPKRAPEHRALKLRDLNFHTHRWAGSDPDPVVLLHGWGDAGETFQFVVDAMPDQHTLVALDHRGFGRTEWPQDGYWFPDYLADLDAWLDVVAPDGPVTLVGHSMGGNIANQYAGVRPERVKRLVNLEGFGLQPTTADQAPERYRQWLEEVKAGDRFASYATYPDYDRLAESLVRRHRHLPRERADFIARAWSSENEQGRIQLRADPRHKRVNPYLYRRDELQACWRNIEAPVLYIAAEESEHYRRIRDVFTIEMLREDFKDVRLEVVQEAGHMLHL